MTKKEMFRYSLEQNPKEVIEEAICLMMERWAEERAGDFDREDFDEISEHLYNEFRKDGGLFEQMVDSAASKIQEWIS